LIYLLEDDESIRNFVLYALNNSGIEACGFDSPSTFYDALKTKIPDLLLLDIMLPEEDGISILKKIRNNSRTSKLPVIMLTAKGSEYDKVIGLDSGADDYVAKPFGMMELISRVKALLRRTSDDSSKNDELKHGNLLLSTSEHSVTVDGQNVNLTFKEFEMLSLLMQNEGKVFSRDMLLQKIWGYDFDGENRTVDVHIRTLRSKLGSAGDYVRTVRGVGYKIGDADDD
jgi:two-component system alkaline phosphatase synthesis response regulator PhoP